MDIGKHRTAIWIAIAALWIACIVLGTIGHFIIGMCLGVILMLLHMLLGVAKKGIVSRKFLIYPLLTWTILWIVSFILSGYYADKFMGVFPSFTVFGIHPSFAPTVFLYWIGGQLTLNLGHYICRDEWLSDSDWEDFCEKAKTIKEGEQK